MAFTQLPAQQFTGNLEFSTLLAADLQATGLTVYRDERIQAGTDAVSINKGTQLFTKRDDIGLYLNFRISGPTQTSYLKDDNDSRQELGLLSCRPGDAEDLASDFFMLSPISMYESENTYTTSNYGLLRAHFDNERLSTYQVFYQDTAASFIVIVQIETSPSVYSYLIFGKINKSVAGSQFVSSTIDTVAREYDFKKDNIYYTYGVNPSPLMTGSHGFFYRHDYIVNGDTRQGWTFTQHDVRDSLNNAYVHTRLGGSEYDRSQGSTTGITSFLPMLYFFRDPTLNRDHLIGQIDDMFVIKMNSYNHGDVVSYGNDSYLVLSMHRKDDPETYNHSNAALVLKLGGV